MQKKIIIYFIIGVILFSSGLLTGGVSTGKRAEELAGRIGVIQGQLNDSLGIVESLRTENKRLIRVNGQLESENIRLAGILEDLQEINERFKEIISGISNTNRSVRSGITEAETGIGSVAKGIRTYLKEDKTQEPDNNN